ncbi:MAG: hypothetical protein V3S24_13105, partial [Candidatus Tectomicrobia bacterium]
PTKATLAMARLKGQPAARRPAQRIENFRVLLLGWGVVYEHLTKLEIARLLGILKEKNQTSLLC